jgi:spermidine synthase
LLNKPRLLFQRRSQNDLVEVWQQKDLRWLNINSVEQTRINTERPDFLVSPVSSAFLAALLFIDTPTSVLLAGLGGGAIARYLHYKNPDITGDALEINAAVAEIAKHYFQFPESQWNLIVDDIQGWQGNHYDLIVLDIADGDITPAWLTTELMLSHLKQQLLSHGVLVINLLVNDAQSLSDKLMTVRKLFERRTLCLAVPDHKNIVVFAFNQQPDYRTIAELNLRVTEVEKIWGLDFNSMLKQLRKDNPEGSDVF